MSSKEGLVMDEMGGYNGNTKIMSATKRKWLVRGIILVVLAALVSLAVIMGPQVLADYRATIVAQKKADIDMIVQSVKAYALKTQNVPQNVISGWCVVGQAYPSGQCLSELGEIGLPQSPDKEPYYYYAAKNYIVVATKLNPAEDGPGRNVGACAPNYGDTYWCMELDRKQFIQVLDNE